VEVELRGPFGSGDYWTIAARTNIGDVLWPVVPGTDEPAAEERHGIRHHYCALAILRRRATGWELVSDCRRQFSSLTNLSAGADSPGGFHILDVVLVANNAPLDNEQLVPVAVLAGGLRLEVAGDLDRRLVSRGSIFVQLDLPFPLSPRDREFWGPALFGYQPLLLDANLELDLEENRSAIRWMPTEATARWLRETLFDRVGPDTRILARLTWRGPIVSRTAPHCFWLVRQPSTGPGGPTDLTTVDINRATEAELIALPRIGRALARAIIANRPYQSIDQLARVPNLRRSDVDALRSRLTV
jgi:hypothetical protein